MKLALEGAIPQRAMLILALGYGLLLLPQFQRLPLWLSLVALGGCVWGLCQHRYRWRPLPKFIRAGLMFALVAIFVATHLGQLTVNTAAAFFVLTVGLKWTEVRQPRDIFVMFMILCYLAAVTFLFEQGIFWSLAVFAAVLVLFASLQALSARTAIPFGLPAWKRLGWTLVKVIPVVAVLFLVFPRLGPLWSVPMVSQRSSAGLSESMSPGQFTDVALSSERAFRVTFGGAPPPASERYWRGLILDRYDGTSWHRSDSASGRRMGRINQSLGSGELAAGEYEVLMEPSFQPWAFALRGSEPTTANLTLTEHGLVEFARPVDTTVRYRMVQSGARTLAPMNAELRQRYTVLPPGINPRTRAWAAQMLNQSGSEERFVQALMGHFRTEPFYYTLQPPALSENSVDAFLFESLEGFCAHYAGAATFALRAVGIPARVIGGYLGGEFGLDDEYLIVRQYDAHAWVEVWLAEHGWVRLDPTAMVAPERVQEGWRDVVSSGDSESARDWAGSRGLGDLPMMAWAQLRLDAANYYWQRFVVGYQGDTQRSLFSRLPGSPDLATLGFWTAGFVALMVAVAGVMLIRRERRGPRDPLVRLTREWQRWMRRRGFTADPSQTPMQQAQTVGKAFPSHRAQVLGFARALTAALYNPDTGTAAQDLEERWRRLKKVPRRPG